MTPHHDGHHGVTPGSFPPKNSKTLYAMLIHSVSVVVAPGLKASQQATHLLLLVVLALLLLAQVIARASRTYSGHLPKKIISSIE